MAMPQVDWESIKSFVQIPLSWFKEVSRRSNLFSKHPLIVIDRNNPDGVGIGIDPTQLPKGGGGGGGGMCGNFAFIDGIVQAGGWMRGASMWDVEALPITDGFTGWVALKVPFSNTGYDDATLQMVTSSPLFGSLNTSTYLMLPIYEFKDGAVAVDYRGCPNLAWFN